MTTGRGGHHYAIGDVVAELRRTYPDVTHSSVRFLEREGLIAPSRTAGGHRLFSRADIDRIGQIKAWQAKGISLAEVRRRLAAQEELRPETLANRFVDAVIRGDPAARQLLLQADDLGMPLHQQFDDVLRPALVSVGHCWEQGRLRVGQEHEVTEAARDVIADLSLRHADPHPAGDPFLAACVAGERHDLGLRMVVGLLRAHGRAVRFLGAEVAARFLAEEVKTRRPAAVLLSATREDRLPAVQETAETLRQAAPVPVPIVLGGQAVRGHDVEIARWGVIPMVAPDLDGALRALEQVTISPAFLPEQ